ncbi:hypothetical protein OHR68_40295 [Spirillospora sp. NBC_00431]
MAERLVSGRGMGDGTIPKLTARVRFPSPAPTPKAQVASVVPDPGIDLVSSRQLIEAWKLVRAPQPDITDRKTRQRRQHLFTHRGQLVGDGYLNDHVIPVLCTEAGHPDAS